MLQKTSNPTTVFSKNAAENRPSFWKYEQGNDLEGEIKSFDSFKHDRYGEQNTVIVELASGKEVSAILNNYLVNGMEMQNAKVGDRVKIQFQGKERSNKGNFFNRFNLEINKNR